MSHPLTFEYLRSALLEIEKCEGPFKRDPREFAESIIMAMAKIAHDAVNGEWDPPEDAARGIKRGSHE